MFFSKQILLGCLVVLAISAFSEASRTRLVTKNIWHKMFAMGKEPRDVYEDDYGYYFRKTLQMHKNKIGYTMENRLGQEVLVTKPFTFGKSPFNKGYASAICPEFEIFCPPGQVEKEGITKGVNLPYQRLPQKFRNPWQSATCQEPAMCVNRRRLRSAQGRLVTSKKWQKMFAMGKEPRGMFEDAYNYYFRKTLQMHRNKVGYTMANSKGQKVLVTKPFTFGKSPFNEGYASASCPEFEISCILGQVIKDMGYAEIDLPYRRLPQKFANPWQVARCQMPPICS